MIGVGLSAVLSGGRKARVNLDPMPALDLNFAANRSLPADYGPTPSFSRASTGTYFNSSGVLTSAAVNVPRFNHVYSGGNWVSRGLLVEEQRTNLCKSSGNLADATYWGRNNAGTGWSVTANSAAAPDGTNTATLMVNGTASLWLGNLASITYTSGVTYTFSIWIKRKSGTGNIWINTNPYGSGGTWLVLSSITSEWVRYSVTQTATATTTPAQAPGIYLDQAGQEVYVWGAQLEAGAFPTSYIPTTSASATRSADVCQITGSDFSSFWNASEGSFAVEYDILYPSDPDKILFAASTNGNSSIYYSDVGNSYYVVYNSGVQAQLSPGSQPAANTTARIALCYKANDFAVTRGGAAVVTDTSGNIPTVNRLDIGDQLGSFKLNGHIARLRYYPTRLTNATLQSFST